MSRTPYLDLNIPDKSSKGFVVTDVFEPNFTKLDQEAERVNLRKLSTEDNIEELKKATRYKVGDVVEVLGYYSKGDGGGHQRQKKPNGYNGADAIIGADGSIWGIVHKGEVNVSWFGAKGDGITDDTEAIQKTINLTNVYIVNFISGKVYCVGAIFVKPLLTLNFNRCSITPIRNFIGTIFSRNITYDKITYTHFKNLNFIPSTTEDSKIESLIDLGRFRESTIDGLYVDTGEGRGYAKNLIKVGDIFTYVNHIKNVYVSGYDFRCDVIIQSYNKGDYNTNTNILTISNCFFWSLYNTKRVIDISKSTVSLIEHCNFEAIPNCDIVLAYGQNCEIKNCWFEPNYTSENILTLKNDDDYTNGGGLIVNSCFFASGQKAVFRSKDKALLTNCRGNLNASGYFSINYPKQQEEYTVRHFSINGTTPSWTGTTGQDKKIINFNANGSFRVINTFNFRPATTNMVSDIMFSNTDDYVVTNSYISGYNKNNFKDLVQEFGFDLENRRTKIKTTEINDYLIKVTMDIVPRYEVYPVTPTKNIVWFDLKFQEPEIAESIKNSQRNTI